MESFIHETETKDSVHAASDPVTNRPKKIHESGTLIEESEVAIDLPITHSRYPKVRAGGLVDAKTYEERRARNERRARIEELELAINWPPITTAKVGADGDQIDADCAEL